MIKYIHALKDIYLKNNHSQENIIHINSSLNWLYHAQAATADSGVSHSYVIGKGWAPSYPETTGYIIPTLLNWSKLSGQNHFAEKAIRMADWELSIQNQDGSFMGSVIGIPNPKPVVFNTGQIIFGLIAAFLFTGNTNYLNASKTAVQWLINNLDQTGIWSRHGNLGEERSHTYNTRVAWAILELGKVTGNDFFREKMINFLDWGLSQEYTDGWFENNCLNDNTNPLLHTIAYTARGFLESGIILNEHRYIDASIRTADALFNTVLPDGRMPGRYNANWEGSSKWSCLTGMAQMSIIWYKLSQITGNTKYSASAQKVNHFLKSTQDLKSNNNGIRGGIKGSFPISGDYGKYRYLNWAAKFFIDSLICESNPDFINNPEFFAG